MSTSKTQSSHYSNHVQLGYILLYIRLDYVVKAFFSPTILWELLNQTDSTSNFKLRDLSNLDNIDFDINWLYSSIIISSERYNDWLQSYMLIFSDWNALHLSHSSQMHFVWARLELTHNIKPMFCMRVCVYVSIRQVKVSQSHVFMLARLHKNVHCTNAKTQHKHNNTVPTMSYRIWYAVILHTINTDY